MATLVKEMEITTGRASSVSTPQEWLETIVLDSLPRQGAWTDDTYLWLTDSSNRLIEFTDGYIEVLPMPTKEHQRIVKRLLYLFVAFLEPLGGEVYFAPLRLRLRSGKYREPDLLMVRTADDPRSQNRFWTGADVVVEVISEDNPARDLKDKRVDYAEANIPEYWIVDPRNQCIIVLTLKDGAYVEHGVFTSSTQATSGLLPDFSVAVEQVFSE